METKLTNYDSFAVAKRDARGQMRLAFLPILFVILGIALAPHAFAQSAPANLIDQPFFYPAPPDGFDPVGASDADLAKYGFPPRPAPGTASYSRWAAVMANAKHRIENPVVQPTGIFHSPPRRAPQPPNAVANTESFYNWSGVDEIYSTPFFASDNNGNGSVVTGGWSHPYLGYENCSYGSYKTWTWVGMDGSGDALAGNNDVLQAGFAAEACPSVNYAWYEWWTLGCTVDTAAQPCSAHSVNLPVNPGDYLYVTVTYHTSSPNGNAFLENQSTGQYVSIGYNQPPGSPGSAYAGYSAEWVVERPSSMATGAYYDLADYYLPNTPSDWFYLYPAYLDNGGWYPPGLDTSGTFNVINMVCTSGTWNPSSACQGTQNISLAYYWSYYQQPPSPYGTECLYLYAAGPAASQ